MRLRHLKRPDRIDIREHFSSAFCSFADIARCAGKFNNAMSVCVYERGGYFCATLEYENDASVPLPLVARVARFDVHAKARHDV